MDELNQEEKNISRLSVEEIAELNEILLNTQEQCQMMEHFIKNQIKVKDELIDRLHKELEYYKQESADKFIEQVVKAVIKVRKDIKRVMSAEKWETMSVEDMKREYSYVYEDLTDLLEQQLVDEYVTQPGDFFDAAIHQAKIEVTDDMYKDKTIKESISEGYIKGKKVIIPERVVVYQYKE